MSTEKSKNVVVTKKARENLVKARAGAITLPKIIGMAFGEGGVSSSGTVIAPTESQSKLNKELFRKAIDGYTFPNDTTCRYECTLAESELAGKEISEIGLYDTNGDIVCIKTFTRKGKDDGAPWTPVALRVSRAVTRTLPSALRSGTALSVHLDWLGKAG